MNHRIRETGGLVWFPPRPARLLPAAAAASRPSAKQYFHYGRWRRVVARTHEGTVNLRYLAPPAGGAGHPRSACSSPRSSGPAC